MRRMAGARSTGTAGVRNGGRKSPLVRLSESACTGRDGTRPGCGARCWSWSATRTGRRWPRPRSARRAGRRGRSWSGCPAGTTSPSWTATSTRSRPNCLSCAGTCSSRRGPAGPAPRPPARRDTEAGGMRDVELSAGTIEYVDTGGEGPVLVLLHGLMMDASLWDEVIAGLSADYRCIAPTLPLGAHRRAVRPGADLSLPGIARLVAEFLDRLGPRDVTLVGHDTGGAIVQVLMAEGNARVARSVLVSCDAFDNFPPGLTGRTLLLAGRLAPSLFGLFMQQMRVRAVRRLPIAFGWLTMRGDAATARWMKPVLTRPAIRR